MKNQGDHQNTSNMIFLLNSGQTLFFPHLDILFTTVRKSDTFSEYVASCVLEVYSENKILALIFKTKIQQ